MHQVSFQLEPFHCELVYLSSLEVVKLLAGRFGVPIHSGPGLVSIFPHLTGANVH